MREILLTKGKIALVDDENFEWLNQWKWYVTKNGNSFYALRHIYVNPKKSIKLYMHRLILGITEPDILCDHRDNNGLNNQRYNLRTCNKSQNQANRNPIKNTSSKYLGVSFNKHSGKWMAMAVKNYKPFYAGIYSDEKQAALAYNKIATEIHGEFARLNKID